MQSKVRPVHKDALLPRMSMHINETTDGLYFFINASLSLSILRQFLIDFFLEIGNQLLNGNDSGMQSWVWVLVLTIQIIAT